MTNVYFPSAESWLSKLVAGFTRKGMGWPLIVQAKPAEIIKRTTFDQMSWFDS